jgi:hypothetical protein
VACNVSRRISQVGTLHSSVPQFCGLGSVGLAFEKSRPTCHHLKGRQLAERPTAFSPGAEAKGLSGRPNLSTFLEERATTNDEVQKVQAVMRRRQELSTLAGRLQEFMQPRSTGNSIFNERSEFRPLEIRLSSSANEILGPSLFEVMDFCLRGKIES